MTYLIASDVSAKFIKDAVSILKRAVQFMNYYTFNGTRTVAMTPSVPSVRTGHIGVHIHAFTVNAPYKNRELAHPVTLGISCISLVDRSQSALSYREFHIR